jgi:hypothetical protein
MTANTERHARLQQKLLDRKSKEPKGRASIPFPIILDADLARKVGEAQRELTAAEAAIAAHRDEQAALAEEGKGDRRVGSSSELPAELTERLDAAEQALEAADAAADEDMVQLVLVALKSDAYDELVKAHPPREGDKEDIESGVNRLTFPDALLRACATRVLDVDDDEIEMDIPDLIDGLSTGERQLARQVAQTVNLQSASVPFYNANSRSRRRNGAK